MLHRTLTSPSWRLVSITLTVSVFIYYRYIIVPQQEELKRLSELGIASSSTTTGDSIFGEHTRLHSPLQDSTRNDQGLISQFFQGLFNYYEYLILQNKLGVLVHLHTVFLLLYYGCRFVLQRFLGNIAQREKDAFSNGIIPYVTINTLFVFYILNHFKNINYLNEIIIWIVWLSIIGILKAFNIICRVRTSTMMEDVLHPQKQKHVDLIILLTIIFSVNFAMIIFATVYVIGFYNNDYSYYFLFIYENVTLLLENARLFAKYGGFVCEMFGLVNNDSKKEEEKQSSFVRTVLGIIFHGETIYVTQFVLEILLLLIAIVHYMHVWYNNGLQFAVIDILLFALINNSFNEFRIQAKKLLEYKKITQVLKDHFPLPTHEEIAQHELCSICHENFSVEELKECRKLECGHIFHLNCINQWMRSSFTCPVCRRELISTKESMSDNESTSSGVNGSTSQQHGNENSNVDENSTSPPEGHHTATLLNTGTNTWLPFSLKIEETTSDIDTSDDEDGERDAIGESAENLDELKNN